MSRHHARSVVRRSTDIAVGAPQVIAHRLARMAAAGASPSSRDRIEFHRMGHEKLVAAQHSWIAMWTQAFSMQQTMWLSWMRACATPWTATSFRSSPPAWLGVWSAGLAPIQRTVNANVRRLSRPTR